MANGKQTIKVWDPIVRIGHWTLVITFFTAYFTEEDLLPVHVWAGYILSAVLVLRILWGFIGTRYARFGSFLYKPTTVIAYLSCLLRAREQHYIGHNPAGGIMVIALLLSLSGTAITGLKLYAVEEDAGPLAVNLPQLEKKLAALSPVSPAYAEIEDREDEDEYERSEIENERNEVEEEGEEFWEELHEFFANFTLLLVFLHVAGVVASSVIDNEKLVKAMLTGKKDVDDSYR
jgi:cytochrome b